MAGFFIEFFMEREIIINQTIDFVKEKLAGDTSGHDWWHIYRVWNMAKKLQEKEGGDLFIIELAALLHDVADWKFHENEEEGLKLISDWLFKLEVSNQIIAKKSFQFERTFLLLQQCNGRVLKFSLKIVLNSKQSY